MHLNKNQKAFYALTRAGLWVSFNDNPNHNANSFKDVDWYKVYQLTQEQSVQGGAMQGLEWFVERGAIYKDHVPQYLLLQWIGEVQMIEQWNRSMNEFVAKLIEKLMQADIYAVLIKGQGIAQCYERPLWRACGDVDLLLSNENYEKAKAILMPLASQIEDEDKKRKHLALTIDSFVVELHGTIHGGLSKRERLGLEDVQKDIFEGGSVRSWMNGQTQTFLPSVDNDILIVFTHILEHFFYGGIGLRQVCDWCRLLWTFREKIDKRLLESRIRKMGLMTEWKGFAALAVSTLGMPVEAMPLYSNDKKWARKGDRIRDIILETGNFGHNRDNSHYQKHSFLVYKAKSFWRNSKDSFRHMMIFPLDATRVWYYRLGEGVEVALKGK